MKFRNITDDALVIPAMGLTVEPGETTPDLDKKEAAGFVGQAESWAAVGEEAKKQQHRTVAKQEGDQE